MPLTAISRAVSASMNDCQLAFVERQPIDIGKAIAQHDQYETCLASLGIVGSETTAIQSDRATRPIRNLPGIAGNRRGFAAGRAEPAGCGLCRRPRHRTG